MSALVFNSKIDNKPKPNVQNPGVSRQKRKCHSPIRRWDAMLQTSSQMHGSFAVIDNRPFDPYSMKKRSLSFTLLFLSLAAWAGGSGLPSRAPELDVLPGFQKPPPGYGEVPFWWWTGDNLDPDRMIGQLKELHKKGISGVQVNYSHYDTPGWLTDQDEPEIFSEDWWKVYSRRSAEACAELDMGIGMSTYTIDWPRGATNLFHKLFYSQARVERDPTRGGRTSDASRRRTPRHSTCAPITLAAHAYPVEDGKLQRGGVDLAPLAKDGSITWTRPGGRVGGLDLPRRAPSRAR